MNETNNNVESMVNIRYGVAQSRRLLIKALKAMSVFKEAITVVGAHAVHVWIQEAWGKIEMEATRDSDVSVNPIFVASDPKIADLLKSIGVEPALTNRPGIYGLVAEGGIPLQARTTFDLIVPEVYAGGGRRAARIPGQKNSASRAVGLELTLWDRSLLTLESVDKPFETIEAYIAGPASLLVSKAHKVHERLKQVATNPTRLRPKDSGDAALLMMISDPGGVAATMRKGIDEHPEIADVVNSAVQWLIEMYSDSLDTPVTRQQAADSLAARFDEDEVFPAIDRWLEDFEKCFKATTG